MKQTMEKIAMQGDNYLSWDLSSSVPTVDYHAYLYLCHEWSREVWSIINQGFWQWGSTTYDGGINHLWWGDQPLMMGGSTTYNGMFGACFNAWNSKYMHELSRTFMKFGKNISWNIHQSQISTGIFRHM